MCLAPLLLSGLLFGQVSDIAAPKIAVPDVAPAWSAAGELPKSAAEAGSSPTPTPIARPKSPVTAGDAAKSPPESALPTESASPTESIPPGKPVGPDKDPLVPVRPDGQDIAPPRTIAKMFRQPDGSKLSGRRLALLDALSTAHDLQRQLDVTHAYWHLAAAAAEYHALFQQVEWLGQFQVRSRDEEILRTVRASAAASLQEAELAVITAQYELAELALLPAGDPLPLPTDQPHVGPYHTHFDEIFSVRSAPGRVRLISRTLPIRRRAIDVRSSAVQAAEEALKAACEDYRLDQTNLEVVLSCMAQVARQRRGLIGSVRDYNHDIVDYALAVIGKPTSGPALVAMLIKPKGETPKQSTPKPGSAVPDRPQQIPPSLPKRDRPTLAPPRDDQKSDRPKQSDRPKKLDRSKQLDGPIAPLPATPSVPSIRTTNKPAINEQGATEPRHAGLYPALVGATPASQAKHLALPLHWDRDLPDELRESITLADCLTECPRMQPNGDCLRAIGAFWLARQRAAEYQVFSEQAELLEGLVPSVPQDRSAMFSPTALSPTATKRLQAARSAAEADLFESHVDLIESQYELTRLVNRPVDSAWLLPSTVPHSGRYLPRLDVQPSELAHSWPMRRLAVTIPALADSVQNHAAAVVEADTARAGAFAGLQAGSRPIGRSLECIRRQTDAALAFLRTLTDYNRTIAQYALAVLPPGIPSEKLLAALVVVQGP